MRQYSTSSGTAAVLVLPPLMYDLHMNTPHVCVYVVRNGKKRSVYPGAEYVAASLIGGAHIKGGGHGPPIFGSMKTSVILTNTQSRFAPVVLDGVLGPPRLAWHA